MCDDHETSQVFLQSIQNEKEGLGSFPSTKISKGLVGWNVRNRYLLLQDIIGYCREVYKVLKYYLCPLTKAGVFEPNHQTILQQDYPDSQEDHHIEAPQQLILTFCNSPVEDPPQISTGCMNS